MDNVVIVDEAHNLIDSITQLNSAELSLFSIRRASGALKAYMKKYASRLAGRNIVNIKHLVLILNRLEQKVHRVQPSDNSGIHESVFSIADFVHDLRIDHLNLFQIQSYLDESRLPMKLLGFIEKHSEKTEHDELRHVSPLRPVQQFLQTLTHSNLDGKVIAHVERENKGKPTLNEQSTVFQFLLLNPASCFEDIVKEAKSVILAGGTMEPVRVLRF
jgi:chromosome transmission fidelity protein 1